MIRYRTAGSRPKSKLSRNKKRNKPCNQGNQGNENTILDRKKIKRAHTQKKYFSTDRGKAALASAKKEYHNTDRGKAVLASAQKGIF